jgi:hypothetical protein
MLALVSFALHSLFPLRWDIVHPRSEVVLRD